MTPSSGADALRVDAVVFDGLESVTIRAVELGAPQPGDVVVRTLRSGVSAGTERWTLTGKFSGMADRFPFIPGYQRVGVVEWVGALVTDRRPGDVVFLNSTRLVDPDLAGKGFTGHIGRSVLPAGLTVPIPPGLSLDEAALSALAAVSWNGVKMSRVQTSDRVLVIGQGVVGLMAAQCARLRGATVIASEPVADRRELARHYAADVVLGADRGEVERHVRSLPAGGVDVIIDTSGRSDVLPWLLGLLRPRGRLCLQGYYPDPIVLDPHATAQGQPTILFPNIWTDHPQALRWLAQGSLRLAPFITHRIPYSDAREVYGELAHDGGRVLAAVIDWSAVPPLLSSPVAGVPGRAVPLTGGVGPTEGALLADRLEQHLRAEGGE